jgi:alpha-tubulin suppressor-like RCC1 family protein
MGSGIVKNRHTPQENKELSRYMEKQGLGDPKAIAAGGYHNVILTTGLNFVITYGAGDYGQLGHGSQWDDPKPKKISQLFAVFKISAGWRHTVVVKRTDDGISQVI